MLVNNGKIEAQNGKLKSGSYPAFEIRGKNGKSCGFGLAIFGSTLFGDDRFTNGIYRRGVNGYNQYHRGDTKRRRQFFVQMRTYAPSNPRTVEQQANRAKFAAAVAAWQGLTDEQKAIYNQASKGKAPGGYGLFIREYMKSH